MNCFRSFVLAGCLLLLILPLRADQRLSQPWEQESVPGSDVISLWQFGTASPTANSVAGGGEVALSPRGAFTADGKFGGGLVCSGTVQPESPTGALVANHADLAPQGAFSVDLWAKATDHGAPGARAFLIDNKGYYYRHDHTRANNGFMLYLTRAQHQNPDWMTLHASLGFGDQSVFLSSIGFAMPLNTWHHFAMSYDGAGLVKLFVNSVKVAERLYPGMGSISKSTRDLHIGERGGSLYHGFNGVIDDVCLRRGVRPYYSGKIFSQVSSKRLAFYRHEDAKPLQLTLENTTGKDLQQPKLTFTFCDQQTNFPLPEVWKLDQKIDATFNLDTSLRAGDYPIKYQLTATQDGKKVTLEDNFPVTIINRVPRFMPVVMRSSWDDPERMVEMGFTHANLHLGGDTPAWDAKQPIDYSGSESGQNMLAKLENRMRVGLRACHYAGAGRLLRNRPEVQYHRLDREGKQQMVGQEKNANVAHPDIQKLGFDSGASTAMSYAEIPIFDSALIHSEVRDSTSLSFQDYDIASAEKFLGGPIPPEAIRKNGVRYTTLANFPTDRVIPDDYPLLRYYTWFWKDGDGWNPLNTQIHRGLQSTGRPIWTFFDPAVRVPSIWGSAGQLDYISQWTYSYPDPIKIGQATDELFAMAEGYPGQQVMKMTQIIWKRTETAPSLPKNPADRKDWENEFPEVKYYSIAPDNLSEALWSKLSRPIKGIMYHGWGSLVTLPDGEYGSYLMTNKETGPRLKKLIDEIVKPLGPTLLEVPDIASDIAILQSFSSQIFAGRGTYGWSRSWEANVHLILQWAGWQPKIIFDEAIRRDGLDQYKILVMPYCDVLTKSVVDDVLAFQKRGGIVIADEHLCPAIIPDILLPEIKLGSNASLRKASLQEASLRLRQELGGVYTARAGSSDLDIVTRVRRLGGTDYLFAINDKREFGDYVGHHRLVMEKGLPHQGTLWIDRPGHVYDLVGNRQVPAHFSDGKLQIAADFGPGEGRLFMISKTAINKLSVQLSGSCRRGAELPVEITISDRWGRKPDAAVPMEVRITDATGQEAEFSGYYTALQGKLTLRLQPATNEQPGAWNITVTNLANGQKTSKICLIK